MSFRPSFKPTSKNDHLSRCPAPRTTTIPVELLVAIFENLDGCSLARCSVVCSTWATLIHYEDVLWRNAAHKDFDHDGLSWSLRVPDPRVLDIVSTHNTAVLDPSDPETNKPAAVVISTSTGRKRTWRDIYRITRNWYTANARGYFPRVYSSSSAIPTNLLPLCIVSLPQRCPFVTIAHHGLIARMSYPLSWLPAVILQDLRTGEVVSHIQGDKAGGIVCHHTRTGSRWLVTGSLDGGVRVWDSVVGKKVRTWLGHHGRVCCVRMNDNVVVSSAFDSTIRVWDLINTTLSPQTPHTNWCDTIDIAAYFPAADNPWIASANELAVSDTLVACAWDSTRPVLVFSLLTGALIYEIRLPDQEGMLKLYMTPFFLLTTGNDRMRCFVNVWDLRTGRMLYQLVPCIESAGFTLGDVQTSEDGARLVVSLYSLPSNVERIYVWNFEEEKRGGDEEKRGEKQHKEEGFVVQKVVEEVINYRGIEKVLGKAWVCWM